MAPMITAGILAHEYGLDPELGNLMVGIGIPLSLATVPIWAWVLARFV
jgi:predicted permease